MVPMERQMLLLLLFPLLPPPPCWQHVQQAMQRRRRQKRRQHPFATPAAIEPPRAPLARRHRCRHQQLLLLRLRQRLTTRTTRTRRRRRMNLLQPPASQRAGRRHATQPYAPPGPSSYARGRVRCSAGSGGVQRHGRVCVSACACWCGRGRSAQPLTTRMLICRSLIMAGCLQTTQPSSASTTVCPHSLHSTTGASARQERRGHSIAPAPARCPAHRTPQLTSSSDGRIASSARRPSGCGCSGKGHACE